MVCSMVLEILTKMLFLNFVGYEKDKYARKKRDFNEPKVIEYYMSFFAGKIIPSNERQWILEYKITPLVKKLSNKEVDKLLDLRYKNERLIAKKKPVNKVPVDDMMIEKYHSEFLEFKKQQVAQQAKAKEQARKTAEKHQHEERLRQMHQRYVYENGESDNDIIEKFFYDNVGR